jgi:hypothetical protein
MNRVGLLLLGVSGMVLGGCVPMVEHYLRIEAPEARYFDSSCHGGAGPPSVIYYPYHGVFISLRITDVVALGVHVPAGFTAQIDSDRVRIVGISDQGSVEVTLPIKAARQGSLGSVHPSEFSGFPDPFTSPDHFGPLEGGTDQGHYRWYLFVARTDPIHLSTTPAGLLRGTVELPPMTINGQHYAPETLHFERKVHTEISPVNC